MDENFPNIWKELGPQIQGANRTPRYFYPNRPSPRHSASKQRKINDKEAICKASKKKKKVTYKKLYEAGKSGTKHSND